MRQTGIAPRSSCPRCRRLNHTTGSWQDIVPISSNFPLEDVARASNVFLEEQGLRIGSKDGCSSSRMLDGGSVEHNHA